MFFLNHRLSLPVPSSRRPVVQFFGRRPNPWACREGLTPSRMTLGKHRIVSELGAARCAPDRNLDIMSKDVETEIHTLE